MPCAPARTNSGGSGSAPVTSGRWRSATGTTTSTTRRTSPTTRTVRRRPTNEAPARQAGGRTHRLSGSAGLSLLPRDPAGALGQTSLNTGDQKSTTGAANPEHGPQVENVPTRGLGAAHAASTAPLCALSCSGSLSL